MVKRLVKRIFWSVGYDVKKIENDYVPFRNFNNLSKAYEKKLEETGMELPKTEGRIELMSELLGTPPSEAYFILYYLISSLNVDGCVCEFGVAQGATSALIANEIRRTEKELHLFDSFEGLPEPGDKDDLKDDIFDIGNMKDYEGKMSHGKGEVIDRLRKIDFPKDRTFIHEGYVEKTLDEKSGIGKVSFSYLDMDLYEPTIKTLNFIRNRIANNGAIVVDDYDFFSEGVKRAVDEFLESEDESEWDFIRPEEDYGNFCILIRG